MGLIDKIKELKTARNQRELDQKRAVDLADLFPVIDEYGPTSEEVKQYVQSKKSKYNEKDYQEWRRIAASMVLLKEDDSEEYGIVKIIQTMPPS